MRGPVARRFRWREGTVAKNRASFRTVSPRTAKRASRPRAVPTAHTELFAILRKIGPSNPGQATVARGYARKMSSLLPTTVVGSYVQPEWLVDRSNLRGRLQPRVRAREMWRVQEEHLEEAQDAATL